MALHLVRVDAARNVFRFYRLDVQADLFGTVSLIREWGRIGQGGTVRVATFTDAETADAELHRVAASKARRGYWAADGVGVAAT